MNPSFLALLALLAILAGSVATSNGATSSTANELNTSDGIVNSPGSFQGSAGPQGPAGPRGKRGPRGPRGKTGARGRTGATGARGPIGASGAMGPAGAAGAAGPMGVQGLTGSTGATGVPGPPGATGATGASGTLAFAQFYALMPPDNPATVDTGSAVDFPQDGPTDGLITRLSADTFNLADIGTYRVVFSVPVDEAGQLMLNLDGVGLGYTVVGRFTGSSAIAGESLVTTTTTNSILSVVNPVGNPSALTITPNAGGGNPGAASLIIEQIR